MGRIFLLVAALVLLPASSMCMITKPTHRNGGNGRISTQSAPSPLAPDSPSRRLSPAGRVRQPFVFAKQGGGTSVPLQEEVFVCVDCETTGLDVEGDDRIIEIAARKFSLNTPAIYEYFHTLVDPQRSIPNTPLHGIHASHVSGKPTISAVLPRLVSFVGNHTVVGHRIIFDLHALQHEARRHNMPLPLDVTNQIDTKRLSMHYGARNTTLAAMSAHFDADSALPLRSHSALSDVDTNIKVLEGLARGYATSGQVFDVLSRPVRARSLPFGKHHGQHMTDVPLQYLEWLHKEAKYMDPDYQHTVSKEVEERRGGGGL